MLHFQILNQCAQLGLANTLDHWGSNQHQSSSCCVLSRPACPSSFPITKWLILIEFCRVSLWLHLNPLMAPQVLCMRLHHMATSGNFSKVRMKSNAVCRSCKALLKLNINIPKCVVDYRLSWSQNWVCWISLTDLIWFGTIITSALSSATCKLIISINYTSASILTKVTRGSSKSRASHKQVTSKSNLCCNQSLSWVSIRLRQSILSSLCVLFVEIVRFWLVVQSLLASDVFSVSVVLACWTWPLASV